MTASASTDEELMSLYVRQGETAAFRELFDRYASRLHSWFSRSTGSPERAADLVQNTFLHVHRARRDFDPKRSFRPWLFTIGANVKREHFRKRYRRPETTLHENHLPGGVKPEASTPEQRVVRRALEQLPDGQRDVVLLRWYSGLTFPEIAAALGLTASAAKVRAHRAMSALRAILGDDHD